MLVVVVGADQWHLGEPCRDTRDVSAHMWFVTVILAAGQKPLEAVEAIVLAANLARERSSDSSSSSSSAADGMPSTSLSGCLLAGCGLGSLTQQQAAAVWQQWQEAAASGDDEDWMDVLQGLAPQWQQPPGMKKLTKKQQAGLDRLRGLVQLATAAAVLGRPVQEVVQVRWPVGAARGRCCGSCCVLVLTHGTACR